MTNHPVAERSASEVRAELAKQRRTATELAAVLGITPQTVGRRLSGETPFDVIELVSAAEWLGVDPRQFIPSQSAGAA